MRLVPDQDPEACYQALRAYLEEQTTSGVRWETKYVHGFRASLVDRNSSGIQAARRALEHTWGVRPLFARFGAGVPVVSMLEEELGVATLLVGFILPDSNIHGPNEPLHLPTWRRGMEALTRFFEEARRSA